MIKLARSLVLPLVLTTALFACDKSKGGSGGGGSSATGAAGASAIAPTKGGLRGALAAMPKETEMILGLDFAQLRKSALWKQFEPKIMEKMGKDLEEFKAICGFDPKEKLTGVLFGGKLPQGELEDATIFIRGFAKSEVVDCLKKGEAKMAEKGNSARVDGNYIELSNGGQVEGGMLFVDDSTILFIMQGGKPADKAGLEAAAAAKDGEGLTSSGAFVKLLDEVKTGSASFFVLNANAGPLAALGGQLPFKMKALFGWTNVGSGVDGAMHVRMDSDKGATTADQMINTMAMPQAKQSPFGKYLDGVKISSKGTDLVITYKLDGKSVEELIQTAQSM